jgi:hypothetical protein
MTAALAEQVQRLDTAEKLELVWIELARRPEEVPMPAWHVAELTDREKAVAQGRTHWIDLEERVREWHESRQ